DFLTDANEERTALFHRLRNEILLESWKKAQLEAIKANEGRTGRLFQKGDLILIRETTLNHNKAAWSMPHRVLHILSQGFGARAEDLTTGKIRETHLSDARFIERPTDPIQVQEWLDDMSKQPGANPASILKTMQLLQMEGLIEIPTRAGKRRKNDVVQVGEENNRILPKPDGPPRKLYRIDEDEQSVEAVEIESSSSDEAYVEADSPENEEFRFL